MSYNDGTLIALHIEMNATFECISLCIYRDYATRFGEYSGFIRIFHKYGGDGKITDIKNVSMYTIAKSAHGWCQIYGFEI